MVFERPTNIKAHQIIHQLKQKSTFVVPRVSKSSSATKRKKNEENQTREEVNEAEMESAAAAARRSRGGGMFEGIYKLVMRRNSVYVTFVILGAFAGERAVDYGVQKLWERNNVGKRYEDISVLGTRQSEE